MPHVSVKRRTCDVTWNRSIIILVGWRSVPSFWEIVGDAISRNGTILTSYSKVIKWQYYWVGRRSVPSFWEIVGDAISRNGTILSSYSKVIKWRNNNISGPAVSAMLKRGTHQNAKQEYYKNTESTATNWQSWESYFIKVIYYYMCWYIIQLHQGCQPMNVKNLEIHGQN